MPYTDEKKYMSIDIGSNAMRASLAYFDESKDLEVFETMRFPLRLGTDAFHDGKIGPKKFTEATKAFQEIQDLMQSYNIDNVKAVATSALRNSANGDEFIDHIKKEVGIKINIIDGNEEASLIHKAVSSYLDLDLENALLIDIGGGSTEFSLVKQNHVVYAKSFPCGTVRLLEKNNQKDIIKEIDKMTDEVLSDVKDTTDIKLCVGTGGNLRRMGKLRKLFFNRSAHKITQQELSAIKAEVSKLSLKQRVLYLSMQEDRADVIVPAMEIIESIMFKMQLNEILLPMIGLKEGVLIDQIGEKPRNIILN